jgi:hypothetical protein
MHPTCRCRPLDSAHSLPFLVGERLLLCSGDGFLNRNAALTHSSNGCYRRIHMAEPVRKRLWTKSRILAEAKRHTTRTAFRNAAPGAHHAAKKLGILTKACEHMRPVQINRPGFWTCERITVVAKKYRSRSEFKANESGAYRAAWQSGMMDQVCAHMRENKKPNGYWTLQRLSREARKYRFRSDFEKGSPAAYNAALRQKVVSEACSHMERKPMPAFWTTQRIRQAARECRSVAEFLQLHPGAYSAASKSGVLKIVCRHMRRSRKPDGYWTEERLRTIAMRFKTRIDFKRRSAAAYTAASRLGLLDQICAHMKFEANTAKRAMYVYVFESRRSGRKYAYVGLTQHYVRRQSGHRSSSNSAVNRLLRLPQFYDCSYTEHDQWMTPSDARAEEIRLIQHYRRKGFTILNRNRGGGLGGFTKYWTPKRIKAEARKYKSRGEFRIKSQSAYYAAQRLNILEDACSHMRFLRRPPFSENDVRLVAKKYSNVKDFYTNDFSFYSAAMRFGILDDVCAGMKKSRRPSGYWTEEVLRDAASQFGTRSEFFHGNLAAYKAAYKQGLIDKICSHMPKRASRNGDAEGSSRHRGRSNGGQRIRKSLRLRAARSGNA